MTALGPSGLLAAAALILGLVGPLDRAPQTAGIVCGLACFAAAATAQTRASAGRRAVGALRCWLPSVAGAPILLRLESPEARLAALGLICLATPGAAARCGALFGAAALAWRLLIFGIPWIRIVEMDLSRVVTRAVGRVTGQSIDFGPTASGLDLLILFALWAAAASDIRPARVFARIGAAAAACCAYVAILPVLGRAPGLVAAGGLFNRANEHLAPAPQEIARVMLGWQPALLAALCLLLPAARGRRAALVRARVPLAAALSIALLILTFAEGLAGGPRRSGAIVFLKSPAVDMEVPSHDRLGLAQAGMFGLLPRYLALDGHTVRVQEGPVTREALWGASVVVAALPTAPYTPGERLLLEDFVIRGGSLLVLADHTDLFGSMKPINDLTGPWGVRVNFDSAYPAVREWRGCLDAAGRAAREATGIGTGASLRIHGAARPLVIGRYALADGGDRANGGRGGWLGDYAYQPGEQLGDVVLAASVRRGRGRAAVFGDTSSFQNLALPRSYPFVASLVDDLARPGGGRPRDAAAAACAALATWLGVLGLAGSRAAAAGLASGVLASLAGLGLAAGAGPLDRLPADAKAALVDGSHLNGYSRDLWRDDAIGGLMVNLQREGYLPLILDDEFPGASIGAAHLPVLVAPHRALTGAETRALAGHIERGGAVLVAAGTAQAAAVAPLLSLHGLRIGDLPLGPVPVLPDMDRAAWEASRKRPQFRNAWPVLCEPGARARSLYGAFGFDVVVEARRGEGAGRLLVIGDPEFLTDRVLEEERAAWEGNVDFLRRLLSRPGEG